MQNNNKHAVFTFGRMNPPTAGHGVLINHVKDLAKKHGADHHIFVSHTQDRKKNPLSHEEKCDFVEKMHPKTNVHRGEPVTSPIHALKHLHSKGYKKVTMVVGSDRQKEMHDLVTKYNGPGGEYHFHKINVVSAGERDPDAEGVKGISASKMRAHAKNKDFASFKSGVANSKHAKSLYKAVRRGMQLENKAIFVVGGPGSGKDIIIRESLSGLNLQEINLEKIYKCILETKDAPELLNNPNIVVNGNAENRKKIELVKTVLEQMGYDTAMIYVYTENEASRRRNEDRMKAGFKTISEEVRAQKYELSSENVQLYYEDFDPFLLLDNSKNAEECSAEETENMNSWLLAIREDMQIFLEKKVKPSTGGLKDACWPGYVAVGTKKKNGKTVPNCVPEETNLEEDNLNSLFEKTFSGNPIQVGLDYTASYHKKNTPNQPEKISEPLKKFSLYKEENKETKKSDKKKKNAPAPAKVTGQYYDSRIGAVPSGGIGLTAFKVEEKDPRVKSAGVEGFNKPKRTSGHPKKSHIVVAKQGDTIKTIRFGEQGAETAGKPKEGESDRMKAKRASFKARHAKNISKGRLSAAYWANKVKW